MDHATTVAEIALPRNTRSALATAVLSSLRFAGQFTDLIVHEGEPIRVKSARGLINLEELDIPGVAGYRPKAEEFKQFFASYLSDSSPRDSAYSYWNENVVPQFAKGLAVNRSLPPMSSEFQQYLRFSILQHRSGKIAMIVRVTNPPAPLESVGLHQSILNRLRNNPKGLLIITGPTASGKTATALSILRYLNENASGHITTVEDPIEYPMVNNRCVFTQREVGVDVATFGMGLRDAMRLAPDAILAGEVRDTDTAESAILGGESGALMIVTTHGRSVTGTLRKILMLAGGDGQTAMRNVLAGALIGVIRQELLPLASGDGFQMYHDTLLASETVRKHIENGAWGELDALCARYDDPRNTVNFVPMRTRIEEDMRKSIVDPNIAMQVAGMRRTA